MGTAAPVTPDPAELWDYLVGKGLSEKDATRHVLLTIQNSPEAVRREFLKDVDPGKLAALGLGAADMMSFGLGKQIAAGLDAAAPESDRSYSALTEEAAQAQHPAAHTIGEVAGLVGPAGVEFGLAKAGRLVPTALGRLVAGISNKSARLAAKTALNATTGAAFAGGQAAGRAPSGQRLAAAKAAAPIGAVVGAALPFAVGSLISGKRLASRLTGPIADFVAGEGPAAAPAARTLAGPPHMAGGVLEDIAQAVADRKAGRISEEDLNTAMEFAGRSMRNPPPAGLLAPSIPTLQGATGPAAPMPGAPQGLLGPEGISPPPKSSYPPSFAEMQGINTAPRNPLVQTTEEAATTAAAKALRLRAREAARNAYNVAITAGQTVAQAKAAAQRAASAVGLLAP